MNIWARKGVWVSKKASKIIKTLDANTLKKITVVRHAALGDMLLTRAFLIEARKAFPNAQITLSVLSNYTRGIPYDLIDHVHTISSPGTRKTIRERIAEIRTLGEQDIIFDLAASNRSAYLCLLSTAKLKIGFPYRRVQARITYDIATQRSDLDFEVTDILKMLNIFGFKTAYPHHFNMPGEQLTRDKPYIAYFIGAAIPRRCWPIENFIELIKNLSKQFPDHDHIVLEGLKEWESADPILKSLSEHKNVISYQADSIEQTTAFLKGAEILVSNDTGIRHLAIVSNTPTVGIFLEDPFRYWPRYNHHKAAYGKDEAGRHASIAKVLSEVEILMGEITKK